MQTKTSEILEIVSAIAVVISLVFVGLEIRNSSKQTELNTQAIRISAYQDLIGRIVELNKLEIEYSLNFDTMVSKASYTPEEILKLDSYIWIIFRHGDMAYFQFENGAISEERLRSVLGPLIGRLGYPYVQKRWNYVRANFVSSYQTYVDNEIKSITSKKTLPSPKIPQ